MQQPSVGLHVGVYQGRVSKLSTPLLNHDELRIGTHIVAEPRQYLAGAANVEHHLFKFKFYKAPLIHKIVLVLNEKSL